MSVKPTPCTQGHIAQWLEHPVYNWEVLGSNPSLVSFLCGPTLSPLGHVSPLIHFPIGLLRSHEFNIEMSGCQNNGPFQITTNSPGSPHQQLPLQMKVRTLMIPLTSSRLVLLPQLNPHLTDSPSNALMLICGTQLVRKRWRLTDAMGLGRLSNYPLKGMQLAPDGL